MNKWNGIFLNLKKFSIASSKSLKREKKSFRKKIKFLETKLQGNENRDSYIKIKQNLEEIVDEIAEGNQIRCQSFEKGEKSNILNLKKSLEFQVKSYYKSEKKFDKKRINKEVKSFIKLYRKTSTEHTLILEILLPPILKENGILLCEEDLT